MALLNEVQRCGQTAIPGTHHANVGLLIANKLRTHRRQVGRGGIVVVGVCAVASIGVIAFKAGVRLCVHHTASRKL